MKRRFSWLRLAGVFLFLFVSWEFGGEIYRQGWLHTIDGNVEWWLVMMTGILASALVMLASAIITTFLFVLGSAIYELLFPEVKA